MFPRAQIAAQSILRNLDYKQPQKKMSRKPISKSPTSTMKTRNILVNRQASRSAAYAPPSSKTPVVDFPTSPQSVTGEQILHYSHRKHPLMEITLSELFVCSGCREYGAGKRFACQQCEFQLHDFCALSPPALKSHPLHGQHQLVFHAKPKQAGISWPKCDVCCKTTKGFVFRCRACSFQMHPCCAMLSNEMKFSPHPHPLKLLPPINPSGGDSGVVCSVCNKKKRSGRVYSCAECNNYHVHAVCAKPFINGLQANGIDTPQKPSVLGTAAQLASHVVIEFIGGLIGGFGEGMGEALAQNLTRGRRATSMRRRA